MSEKVVLSTSKSLYPSLEIEIDGVSYFSSSLNAELIEKLGAPEARIEDDPGAIFEQVSIIFGIPVGVARKLDIREIRLMLERWRELYKEEAKGALSDEEKKSSDALPS